MKPPQQEDFGIYIAIIGVSALLCFSLLLTSSFWLTMAIMTLGLLHMARYFPHMEAFIVSDPLLLWLRRISPLIILGIYGIVYVTHSLH